MNHIFYGTVLFIISHFFVKEIVFFDLIKGISILFTFRISAMRLFTFMSFFSLHLYADEILIECHC